MILFFLRCASKETPKRRGAPALTGENSVRGRQYQAHSQGKDIHPEVKSEKSEGKQLTLRSGLHQPYDGKEVCQTKPEIDERERVLTQGILMDM